METFKWGKVFETGMKNVDDQHKILVERINAFGSELAENDMQSSNCTAILHELITYAQNHFKDEEEIMSHLMLDSRHIDQHVQEHLNFVDDILAMSEQVQHQKSASGESLLRFLIHWLAYHILGSDHNMARQISVIEKGGSPENAYLAEERKAASSTEPLLNALNSLFQQVSSRNKELTQINKTLEAKVAERTEELYKANRDLQVLALTDALTGLPNRRHAMTQLDKLWQESTSSGTPLSCMMIDADNFKAINDSYGHDAGDKVLRELARTLQHSVRTDDVVCRLGGDEFFIICPATPLEGAIHLAQLIKNRVNELKVLTGKGYWLGSISMGVAVNSSEIDCIDQLLKTADDSVYMAKRSGRNCVCSQQGSAGRE